MASDPEEHKRLLQEINRLRQDKKILNLRVQGVEVLAKVFQESQEENSKLKQEVQELRGELQGTSMDVSPSLLSLKTTPSLNKERCFLSQPEDDSFGFSQSSVDQSFEYVNVNPNYNLQAGPSSTSAPSHHDIKNLSSEFKAIKNESDMLLQQAKEMFEFIKSIKDKTEREDLTNKIATLVQKIGNHAKDAKTRETLLQGLANEEEHLKEKVVAMDIEQVTQGKVMEDLKLRVEDYKKQLDNIRKEMDLFSEPVIVNKEDCSLENFSSSSTASNSLSNRESSLSKLSSEDPEWTAIGTRDSSCRRCLELFEQLNKAKKEKEDTIHQKEEILDVNHAWDAQYKKLKAEKGKEIADLKQQIELLKTSDLWMSATSMINEQRHANEKILEDKKKTEAKCKRLEEELKLSYQNKAEHKAMDSSPLNQTAGFPYTAYSQPIPASSQSAGLLPITPSSQDVVKEIEVLKQQLRVYVDDFACERQDRERMQSEKEVLEHELRDVKEQVGVLKEQLRVYEEDFRKESQEKDRLRRQLNSHREGGDQDTKVNEMTRKAQAVAERQAKLRALRDQYDREERQLLQDQQDLQQRTRVMAIQPESQHSRYRGDLYALTRPWPQQGIHPRGAPETQTPSGDMFHGGEVQADSRDLGREVVDGANDDSCCPRCFRSFKRDDQEAFTRHKVKCIE